MSGPMRKFTADVPAEAYDRFRQFILDGGYKKYRAAAAAFDLFVIAPQDVRQHVMQGDINVARAWLEDAEAAMAAAHLDPIAEG